MSLRSWFRGSSTAASPRSSSPSRSTTPIPNGGTLTPVDQKIADIEHAMAATGLIMDDDPEGAEARLLERKDPTAFHQLGLGVTGFMRAILGFEKEIMTETANRLYECENKAWADKEKAEKRGKGDPGQLHPPGAEYALVYAMALLMNAIVSVLHESLTDAVKGFYKLRKAFQALNKIVAAQDQILKERGLPTSSTVGLPPSIEGVALAEPGQDTPPAVPKADREDAFEFVDALESLSGTQTPRSPPGGPLGGAEISQGSAGSASASGTSTPSLDRKLAELRLTPNSMAANASTPARSQTASPQPPGTPSGGIFTHSVDVFVHSGTNMCLGILLLVLSMIPPAFSRLLSIIGFSGDKERGMTMLWQSTAYPNVNGAVAGMMVLAFYNGFVGAADVLPSDRDIADLSEGGEIVGYPRERCAALLQTMRERYPNSRMWKLEEARMLSHQRRVHEAVEVLTANTDSKMRQVAALNYFELALCYKYIMDWPRMKAAFIKMVEMNDWSHALYYYIAACAELEMYRDAANALAEMGWPVETDEGIEEKEAGGQEKEMDVESGAGNDTTKKALSKAELQASARQHKKAAEELFRKAPTAAGRKRFMARQMPFEAFVIRKVAKWEERAAALGIDLADAIGPSPAQEMIYMWNGPRRLTPDLLRRALEGLEWERCTAPADKLTAIQAEADEAGMYNLCKAVLLRQLGEDAEARTLLEAVVKRDRSEYKGGNKDDYVLPSAHYELGVLAWVDVCEPERWPKDAAEVEAFRQKKTDECASLLDTVAKWEAYLLDARFGMKVSTGLDSVRWLRGKKGWAAV